MAKTRCVSPAVGLKRNGRLKKGFKWSKGKKHCILKAKAAKGKKVVRRRRRAKK